MASSDALDSHPDSSQCAKALHSFQAILRAAWLIAATPTGTTQCVQQRFQRPTVEMNQKNNDFGHSGAWQNRKLPGEKQPFVSQFFVTCRGRCGFCRYHHQPARQNRRPMMTTDFTQPASDSIARHRPANPARRHKSKTSLAINACGAEAQESSLHRPALFANESEFPTEANARTAGKAEAIRLRCDERSGFRHPSARAVCGRVGGGG